MELQFLSPKPKQNKNTRKTQTGPVKRQISRYGVTVRSMHGGALLAELPAPFSSWDGRLRRNERQASILNQRGRRKHAPSRRPGLMTGRLRRSRRNERQASRLDRRGRRKHASSRRSCRMAIYSYERRRGVPAAAVQQRWLLEGGTGRDRADKGGRDNLNVGSARLLFWLANSKIAIARSTWRANSSPSYGTYQIL
jgi:hypothetical protein